MKFFMLFTMIFMVSYQANATLYCNAPIKNQSINESVKVGRDCNMENLIVNGDIVLQEGANLNIKNSQINGNISSNAKFHSFSALENTIRGNIDVSAGKNIDIQSNHVNGALALRKNTGVISIYTNHIAGNLDCSSNSFTINGGQNIVNGQKLEQCQTF
jgi:hypothetical protein